MVAAPNSLATRLIETAARPSASATRTAASTMAGTLIPGRGPLGGRSRSPHALSMAAGSTGPLSSVFAATFPPCPAILVLRMVYA